MNATVSERVSSRRTAIASKGKQVATAGVKSRQEKLRGHEPKQSPRPLSPETQAWVKKVMERAIDFIPDESFESPQARRLLTPDRVLPTLRSAPVEDDETSLLEKHEEAYLFQRMNYLKCVAEKLKRKLNPSKPNLDKVTKIADLIEESMDVRNRIIRANMRLVVSIAKKYVSAMVAFDEIMSEAHFSLIQAVEKFNIGRGNKFSTYATRAILNNLNHYVNRKRRRSQICIPTDDGMLQAAPDHRWQAPLMAAQVESSKKTIAALLERLDPEKRAIIQARFGFGGDDKGLSLKKIGDDMGVSRERVRQIEGRALAELRHMADEVHLELPEEF